MGLVMVCPQCQANVLLQSQNCPYCQADLRDVPQGQRRYLVGQPGPSTPPAAPEPAPESRSIPVLESAAVPEKASPTMTGSEVKVRRPHVRRYAAEPVAVTHPVAAAKPAKKAEPKKAKKASAKKKK
jgi:hypothetical protein